MLESMGRGLNGVSARGSTATVPAQPPDPVLKQLEVIGKSVLALLLGALFFRPGRRARAAKRLGEAKKLLLVRIDNRVGEALLTTPLFDALAQQGGYQVHVLVHPKAAR